MNRKQKIIISITGIVLVSLILIGLTYAYFLTQITGNTNTKSISVSTANLELVYGDGNGVLSPTEKLEPGDTVGIKEFTVTNNGNNTVKGYLVIFRNVTNTLSRPEDLVYTVECKQYINDVETGTCDGVEYETQLPTGTGSGSGVIVSNDIDAGFVQKYSLTLKYLEPNVDQSEDMGKNIEAKIDIMDVKMLNSENGITNYASNTLAGTIINNTINKRNGTELVGKTLTKPGVEYSKIKYAKADETLIVEKDSTITDTILNTNYYYADDYFINSENKIELINPSSGLYKDIYTKINGKYISTNIIGTTRHVISASDTTYKYKIISTPTLERKSIEKELSVITDNYGISYYYRGGVEDNYINFNNMCWRIMRIEGDGSIKLILADKNNVCESSNYGNSKHSQFISRGTMIGDATDESSKKFLTYLEGMENNSTNSMANALDKFINGGTYTFEEAGDDEELSYWKENAIYDEDKCLFKISYSGFSQENINKLRNDNYCFDENYLDYKKITNDDYHYLVSSNLLWISGILFGGKAAYIPENIYKLYVEDKMVLNNKETRCNNSIKFSSVLSEEVILAGYSNKSETETIKNYLNDNYSYDWMINGVTVAGNLTFGNSSSGIIKYGNLVSQTKIISPTATIRGSELIRPSINLKSGIKYITGEGTKNNPYEIN